jgi:hypothetical protein
MVTRSRLVHKKVKPNAKSPLLQYISEVNDVCDKSIVAQQRSRVIQHLSGSKHTATVVGLKDRLGRKFPTGQLPYTILYLSILLH